MAAMSNWIDRLWTNPRDREAQDELRKLWLGFQADRKAAWDQLQALATASQKLLTVAQNEIRAEMYGLPREQMDNLVFKAVQKATEILREIRWTIPATNRGVFVPYLQHRSTGLHDWVERAISDFRRWHGEPFDEERPSDRRRAGRGGDL